MADEYVTKAEYAAYQKTADAERELLVEANKHQDSRIDKLETEIMTIQNLALSVNTLATNMQHMLEELKSQGARLESLEKKDGDMWRNLTKALVSGVAMLIIGYVFGKMAG